MKTNCHLYGEGVDVPKLDNDVMLKRIDLLSENLRKLLDHSYWTRDGGRVNDVLKAIDFYRNLIKENNKETK